MFSKVATKIFGSRNQRMLKKMAKSVEDIGQLEPHLQTLSDDELERRIQCLLDSPDVKQRLNEVLIEKQLKRTIEPKHQKLPVTERPVG